VVASNLKILGATQEFFDVGIIVIIVTPLQLSSKKLKILVEIKKDLSLYYYYLSYILCFNKERGIEYA